MGDRGAAELASALANGRCTLKRLDLSRCGLSPRSATPLAAMLQARPHDAAHSRHQHAFKS